MLMLGPPTNKIIDSAMHGQHMSNHVLKLTADPYATE